MFDIGWTELLVIGVVALIVVGPKDLPGMFRTLGRFTAKARALASDFSRAMEEAADETGVKDVAKDLKDATSARKMGLDRIQDAVSDFEKWTPDALDKGGARKGPATQALSEERAQTAKKIQEATAKAASDRLAAEAALAEATPAKPAAGAKRAAATTTASKPAARKPAAKKPAAGKPAGKKPAAKKPSSPGPAAKPAARKPAPRKPARKSEG